MTKKSKIKVYGLVKKALETSRNQIKTKNYEITTALKPTQKSAAALRGKVIGGAAYAERYGQGIMEIEEIIEMNLPSWNYVINKFKESNFSSPYIDYSRSNNSNETKDILCEILAMLLIHFAKASRVKDEFSNPYCYQLPHYPSVNLTSEKLETAFTFGIYQNNYYLTIDIHYHFYLKSMDDKFWKYFVELSEFGKFEFIENISPSSEKAKDIEKTLGKCKSNVFNLIKNYILLEESGGSGDIGSLKVSWPVTIEINELIDNAINSFRNLHKVNYLLHRRYYINNKRR